MSDLPNPEVVGQPSYGFTMARTLLLSSSMPEVVMTEVQQSEIQQFMSELTLKLADVTYDIASVHFLAHPRILIQHPPELSEHDNSGAIDGTGLETVKGISYRISDYFIACRKYRNTITFQSLRSIIESGEISKYTRDTVKKLSYDGQYEDPITYALQRLFEIKPTNKQRPLF